MPLSDIQSNIDKALQKKDESSVGQYDTQAMREQDFARFAIGLKRGCTLTWIDADTVEIGEGTIWIEGRSLQITTAIQINLSDADHREAGVAEANSTDYYVYVRQSRSDLDEFEGFFSTTAPDVTSNGRHPTINAAHVGDATNDASGNLEDFTEATAGTIGSFLDGSRKGCVLTWIDATTVEVSAGSLWYDGAVLTNAAAIQIDLSVAGDREAAVAEANNTFYYIYATQGTGSAFSCYFTTTAPTAKGTGMKPSSEDVYLGAVRNNGSGDIRQFIQHGNVFQYAASHQDYTRGSACPYVSFTSTAPPNMLGDFQLYTYAARLTQGLFQVVAYLRAVGGVAGVLSQNAIDYCYGPASYDGPFTRGFVSVDGSSQLQINVGFNGASSGTVTVQVVGWVDPFLP